MHAYMPAYVQRHCTFPARAIALSPLPSTTKHHHVQQRPNQQLTNATRSQFHTRALSCRTILDTRAHWTYATGPAALHSHTRQRDDVRLEPAVRQLSVRRRHDGPALAAGYSQPDTWRGAELQPTHRRRHHRAAGA